MTEDRGGLRPLMDSLGGLLSNPVVLEGLIAGISAISASRRTKRSGEGEPSPIGGILDMLPGMLPLLSVFAGGRETNGDASDASGAVSVFADETPATETDGETSDADGNGDTGENGAPLLFGEASDVPAGAAAEAGAFDVSYESQASQRENLLLAIRPFLSESRRSAADAMVQVNKLSGLFRQR